MAGEGMTRSGTNPRSSTGAPTVAAMHALLVGAVGAGVVVLLARRWLAGAPAVTVAELWEPGLVLFAPGDEMASPLGGPPLLVTTSIIHALAAGQIALFGTLGLLGLMAGSALLARHAAGRIVATILFSALLLLGLSNLAALAVAAVIFEGSLLTVLPMATAIAVGLVLLPGWSLWSVRRAAGDAPRRGDSRGRAWSVVLALHFGLLAILLSLTALTGQGPSLLMGPWLLTGGFALIVGLGLAGAHAVACLLFARRHPAARRFGAALSGLAALALGLSAWLAPAGVLEQSAGLPGQHRGLRVVSALAALLSAGLALQLQLGRGRGRSLRRP